jgi:hypothetical protein
VSPQPAEVAAVSAFANPANGFGYNLSGQRLARVEDPYSSLLVHTGNFAHWTQHNAVVAALKFQGISGLEFQFIPHGLGEDDPAGFVDCQRGNHVAILPL